MIFYIIRHGETALNAKGIMQGRLDEPLDKSGRDLAVLTGRAMKNIRFDRCISSPLKRARETAGTILRESENDVRIETDERLIEIDFGSLEGKTRSEMGEAGELFYTDPFRYAGFPHGERIQDVCARTREFLMELIARDDGKTYLISTHGCAMRAMVNFLHKNPADFWGGHIPYNCSATIVEAEHGVARIVAADRVFYKRQGSIALSDKKESPARFE